MKIAYIVPYVPNKIRTRSYNLIHQLSRLGHKVAVFTLGSNETDLADAKSLRAACQEVYCDGQPIWQSFLNCTLALPSNTPLQSVYSWNPDVAKKWLTLLRKGDGEFGGFDIIHVEHLRGSRYGTFLKSMLPAMPVVWDSVDCISYLFQQAAARSGSLFGRVMTSFELGRTRKAEGNLVGRFDRVLVTSVTDKQALTELVPAGKQSGIISVLPNGVDLDYFKPDPSVRRDPETIVFSGKMSYHANISMVKYLVGEIMPGVWARCPNAKLIDSRERSAGRYSVADCQSIDHRDRYGGGYPTIFVAGDRGCCASRLWGRDSEQDSGGDGDRDASGRNLKSGFCTASHNWQRLACC